MWIFCLIGQKILSTDIFIRQVVNCDIKLHLFRNMKLAQNHSLLLDHTIGITYTIGLCSRPIYWLLFCYVTTEFYHLPFSVCNITKNRLIYWSSLFLTLKSSIHWVTCTLIWIANCPFMSKRGQLHKLLNWECGFSFNEVGSKIMILIENLIHNLWFLSVTILVLTAIVALLNVELLVMCSVSCLAVAIFKTS